MANLNKEQARAVEHLNGPCLVLAGPGSGKTFTLVERIRHLIEDVFVPPEQILVITFSKKAAMEMQERFENLTECKGYAVYFGTFHAVFYSIVRSYYGYGKNNILTESQKLSYLRQILKKLKISEDEEYIERTINKISRYKTVIGDEKKRQAFLCEEFIHSTEADIFMKIYDIYSLRCRSEHKLDFDDMLYMCFEILTHNTHLLNKYRSIYRYFLVDEFQDINDVQYDVLKLLAGEDRNIFAVGDDDQSIYGFRGANPEIMSRFIDENPDVNVIDMCRNYRSARCVIEMAGKLISINTRRISKHQEACKDNKEEGAVNIISLQNANVEAAYVCEQLKKIKKEGIPLSNTAVLYRTNRCSGILEEKLDMVGLKFNKRGNPTDFYNYEWVKDILAFMKIAIGKYDETTILRIINKPDREIDREDVVTGEVESFLEEIRVMSHMPPFAAVAYVLKALKYEEYMNVDLIKKGYSEEQVALIKNEILERARMFRTINSWLDHIRCFENTNIDASNIKSDLNTGNENIDSVNLMTIHTSKGLEFDTVFIIGLQEGIFPGNKSCSEEQIEEERRLLYVAMTRAKRHLYIIGRGDNKHGKRVSRFVAELTK